MGCTDLSLPSNDRSRRHRSPFCWSRWVNAPNISAVNPSIVGRARSMSFELSRPEGHTTAKHAHPDLTKSYSDAAGPGAAMLAAMSTTSAMEKLLRPPMGFGCQSGAWFR